MKSKSPSSRDFETLIREKVEPHSGQFIALHRHLAECALGIEHIASYLSEDEQCPLDTRQYATELLRRTAILRLDALVKAARFNVELLRIPQFDSLMRGDLGHEFTDCVLHLRKFLAEFQEDAHRLHADTALTAEEALAAMQRFSSVVQGLRDEAGKLPISMPTCEDINKSHPQQAENRHEYLKTRLPRNLANLQNLLDSMCDLTESECKRQAARLPSSASPQQAKEALAEADKRLQARFSELGLATLQADAIIKRDTLSEEEMSSATATASHTSDSSVRSKPRKPKVRVRKPAAAATGSSVVAAERAPTYDKAFKESMKTRASNAVRVANAKVYQARMGAEECVNDKGKNVAWLEKIFAGAQEPLQAHIDELKRHIENLALAIEEADASGQPKGSLVSAQGALMMPKESLEARLKLLAEEKTAVQHRMFHLSPQPGLYEILSNSGELTTRCLEYDRLTFSPEWGEYRLDKYNVRDKEGRLIAQGHTHRNAQTGKVEASHLKRASQAHLPTTRQFRPHRGYNPHEEEKLDASFRKRSEEAAPRTAG